MLLWTAKTHNTDSNGTFDKLKLQSCLPAGCHVAVDGLLLLDHAHNLAEIVHVSSDCHAGD